MKLYALPRIAAVLLSLMLLALFSVACGSQASQADQTTQLQKTSLNNIKQYTQDKGKQFKAITVTLKNASNSYYTLAKAENFDYAKLAKEQPTQVLAALQQARSALLSALPIYAQMQGIVSSISSLQQYDTIIASGVPSSGVAAADNITNDQQGSVVPYNLTLPNGKVLEAPGNLFDVTENSLWGLMRAYQTNVPFDYQNGNIKVGTTLPDANVLSAAAVTLDQYVGQLQTEIQKWQPTLSDIFNALTSDLANVQNMFASWEITLFVANSDVKQFDMHIHSQLNDFFTMIDGWQKIYGMLGPLVQTVDHTQDTQINTAFNNLKQYVDTMQKQYAQNPQSEHFTIVNVDLQKTEAANRANTVHDDIVTVAAKFKVAVQQ